MNDSSQLAKVSGRYPYFVAGFLALIYTFNFLDRQILSILQEPMRKELGLSDTQLGILSGLTFALFYTVFGIPIAWLADRSNRVRIIAVACGIWSFFSAACGFAGSFVQLALCRIGVATGEAGGSPPSYSLIADYFPPQKRGTGLAIYSLGVPFGSLIGSAAGGWVAATYGWRMTFYAVGLPGLVLAVLAWIIIREPQRGRLDVLAAGAHAHDPSPPLLEAIATFFRNKTLALTALSSGCSAFVGYAMLHWAPSFLIRVKHMTLKEIALYYSFVMGISMAFGTFGSGWMVDRLSRRNKRAYALLPATAFAVTIPFFIGLVWAPTWPIALAFLAVPSLLNNMYLAPAITVVQNAAPPAQRTISSAILLFVLNLVGLGGGPLYIGMVSDHFKPTYGDDALKIAMLALLPFILVTVGAHIAAARSIKRD